MSQERVFSVVDPYMQPNARTMQTSESASAEARNGMSRQFSRHKQFPAHGVIFFEGDPASNIYEVASGSVMLYKLLPDGRRQVVEILGPGDLFGVPAGEVYDVSAETLTETLVHLMTRKEAENSDSMQEHMKKCLVSQVQNLHEHAVLLGRKSAHERVASFLMRFVPSRGDFTCIGPQDDVDESVVTLNMTRQEIADFLGLTIETVSRVLSDMKRRKVITMEKQDRIRVMNVCGLCHLTGKY
ncbi:Crp/Fnr family transcriptional regulator [Cohaesibacter gelatinilyticus]|uniref:CRP/FNR family transcriptional regulator, anaerobic regulatory protein n=1 Tax=Cohaesibacter gelatinilyticus TaxID=372072 RepID=A0A285N863_9HYPH|nr:helix-turn-helix domain-containing protein [Cohaesibacter gelatinilyticus]SNZ05077.1 CRP/FNR family transcriptional regulator, anaerobic regulatory protein [Cohaesibacter gelatinilyticus]